MENYIDLWLKQRTCFIAIMCSISLYGWCRCSLYDTPYSAECKAVYNTNCSLFILYLCWDMCKVFSRTQTINDKLIAHHIFSIVGIMNNFSLQTSHVMMSLSMSLMDYVLKKQNGPITLYRSSCILFIRIPLATYFALVYNPTIVSYNEIKMNNTPYSICFIMYDTYLLYSLCRPFMPYFRNLIQIKSKDMQSVLHLFSFETPILHRTKQEN
jgi:hypothetical protein